MNKSNGNEVQLSLFDLVIVFKKNIKKIISYSLLFSLIFTFFLIFIYGPPSYKVKALFEEKDNFLEKDSLSSFFALSKKNDDSIASQLMKSSRVMIPMIKKLGLQIKVIDSKKNIFKKIFNRVDSSYFFYKNNLLKSKDKFLFSDVKYKKQKIKNYYLLFKNPEEVCLLNNKKELIKKEKIFNRITYKDISFKIDKIKKNLILNHLYKVEFSPLEKVWEKYQRKIFIKNKKSSKNLIKLQIIDDDKEFAEKILNTLMDSYLSYKKKENRTAFEEEITFLIQKKEDIEKKYEENLEEYNNFLVGNFEKNIYFSSQMPIDNIGNFLKLNREKINELDEQKKSLSEDFKYLNNLNYFENDILAKNIFDEISSLELEKEMLSFSLQDINIFDEVKKEKDFPLEKAFSKELKQEEETNFKREYFKKISLDNFSNINKDSFSGKKDFNNTLFKSNNNLFDIQSLKELYLIYEKKLEDISYTIKSLKKIIDKIFLDDFDIRPLVSILHDFSSQEILKRASSILYTLSDIENTTLKDRKRAEKELLLSKENLKNHLEKLLKFNIAKQKDLQENVISLKKDLLLSIDQKLDFYQKKKENLFFSKLNLIEKKKKEFLSKEKENIETLFLYPKILKEEKKILLNAQLKQKTLKTINTLLDKKIYDAEINKVRSKIIDPASSFFSLYRQNIQLKLLIFFLVFSVLYYLLYVFKFILKGPFISKKNLLLNRFSYLGKLYKDKKVLNSNTLRNIASFIEEKKEDKIVCLQFNGNLYRGFELAKILKKRGKRVLLIQKEFSSIHEKKYMEDFLSQDLNELPLFKEEGIDLLFFLNDERKNNIEMLYSKKFKKTIYDLTYKYDHIIINTKENFLSSLNRYILNIANINIIGFKEEPFEMIDEFLKWEDNSYCRYLTFIDIS